VPALLNAMCRAPKAPTVFSTSATMSGNPAAGDDHNRAFFGKRQGSGFADAGGASGDEDSLVLEGFHIWPQRSGCRFFGKVNGVLSFVGVSISGI
jgi:hypothetical protein